MAGLVESVAAMSLPLPAKLELLREAAGRESRQERLLRWAANHPEIAGGDDWCRRAWWGAAAGEVVRDHLYDPERRADALRLVEAADWTALDEPRRNGGVILAAAHLGPPKVLMNLLLDRDLPLAVWTNTRDMPAWLRRQSRATLFDPLQADQRGVLLVRSAAHLRAGGVLLAAADQATGQRPVEIERLGIRWRFSRGLPALARRLGVPVILALALWRGERIHVECRRLEPPDESLADDAWQLAWLERYVEAVEPTIRQSPENLRFLRWAVDRVARPWEAAPGD